MIRFHTGSAEVQIEDRAWKVWNRACNDQPGTGLGDRHLHALINVHGVTMNGGTSHSAHIRSVDDFDRAARACEYLQLPELAALLREIAGGGVHG